MFHHELEWDERFGIDWVGWPSFAPLGLDVLIKSFSRATDPRGSHPWLLTVTPLGLNQLHQHLSCPALARNAESAPPILQNSSVFIRVYLWPFGLNERKPKALAAHPFMKYSGLLSSSPLRLSH